VTLQQGYIITISGFYGAKSATASTTVLLEDNSGGCQHQNLFTSSLNSTELGTASWDPVLGALQIVVATSLVQVLQRFAGG